MAVRTLLMMVMAFLFLAAAEEENQRKNIKILFVPSEVIRALHKNLTVKDLPPGLPVQGTQRWAPVLLPGDKTRSFEIRINPTAAQKLHIGLQSLRIGRSHGLLLEMKNVSLSTKGKSVLDSLVEFYKNCHEERKNHDLSLLHLLHRIRRPHLSHLSVDHSLVLPGDVPVLKRIQEVLHRFFPKRLDGSVDVFQSKDSSGAIHFLPLDEVRQEVNNLLKRTVTSKRCIKISTDALTRALEAFRRQENRTSTKNSNIVMADNRDKTHIGDIHTDERSFGHNLKSLNLHPERNENFTSFPSISVPGNATATAKIASYLAEIRKIFKHMSGDINQKLDPSVFQGNKARFLSSKVENKSLVNIAGKNVSSDNTDNKDYQDEMAFLLGEVKKRPKNTRSDQSDDRDVGNNNVNVDDIYVYSGNNCGGDKGTNTGNATGIETTEQGLLAGKTKSGRVPVEVKRNVSTIPVTSGGNDRNTQPVNQTVNLNQLAKVFRDAEGIKVIQSLFALEHLKEREKMSQQKTSKHRRNKARKRGKHYYKQHAKYRGSRGDHSVDFHYKPKSRRFKLHHKGVKYVRIKENDEEDDSDSKKYREEERLIKLVHMRRHKPRFKEMKFQDNLNEQDELDKQDKQDKQGGYRQRNYDGSLFDASYDEGEDLTKARLLRKLRAHGHAGFVRRRKSPKLRVIVYDDEEEEKEPHDDNLQSSRTEDYASKIHEDSDEAESEAFAESSESSEGSKHRQEPVLMDDENTQPYEEGGISNSRPENFDYDTQHLSDSIGSDDNSHLGQSPGEVPDLRPYLNKNYEDEEDAENEEIKMYNEQDDSLGNPMAKRISKSSEQVERMEDTNRKMYNEFEEPGRIHIHKLPLKIGEDSNRIGVRLPAQPPRNALGLQTILPQLSPPFMGSGPMSVSPPALTDNQNGIDLRPNVVMPLDQSFMLPGAGQVPQMTGNAQMETPNMATFSNSNFQPGVTNEVNNMIPQTAFSQASSMFPMQTDSTGTPMNPNMQPGQVKSVISGSKNRTRKPAVKKTDSHQKRLIIQRGEKIKGLINVK